MHLRIDVAALQLEHAEDARISAAVLRLYHGGTSRTSYVPIEAAPCVLAQHVRVCVSESVCLCLHDRHAGAVMCTQMVCAINIALMFRH